ncbi:MAG: HEAT repeat domain-containing protein [bacterium]
MSTASEKKREIFDFFTHHSEKISGNTELIRAAKELAGLFGKVIRGYNLYPRTNPAFTRFAEQFKEKLDEIFINFPTISLKISTRGFMVGKRVIDTSEKDKEIVFFLYNDGLREIFFQKGTSREEITEFFNILAQCTLFANEDYDLATLLWDHNFANIGYVTEDELIRINLELERDSNYSPFTVEELAYGEGYDSIGDGGIDGEGDEGDSAEDSAKGSSFEEDEFEKHSALIFKEHDNIDLNERKMQLNERITNSSVGKMEMFKFDEALKKNSDNFVVNRFLRELSSRLISSRGDKHGLDLLETAASLWEKLLLFGSVKGAVIFIKALKAIAEKLEEEQPEYSKKIREGFSALNDTEFLEDLFSTVESLPQDELEAIGEILAMVPSERIGFILSKINEIESAQTRIDIINSFSKFISISEELLSLTRHEDWRVVRNAFSLMKDKNDPRIVGSIRNALSHPQKQAQVEALGLLMEFSIEEAMPALEKAVFSSEREVRTVAFRKVMELREPKVKAIVNRAFQIHNLQKLEHDEIDEHLKLVVSSRREDLYDLLGNILFSDESNIKNKAVDAILTSPTLTPFSKLIARASDISVISKMKNDDLKHFCKLYKPETFKDLLPALTVLFPMRSGLFNKTTANVKEAVFKALLIYVDNSDVVSFFKKGIATGTKETANMINKIAGKLI